MSALAHSPAVMRIDNILHIENFVNVEYMIRYGRIMNLNERIQLMRSG